MEIETLTLDIEKLAARQSVSREWLKHMELQKAETGEDWMSDTVTYQLVRKIASVGGERVHVPEIRVPATWWDALKERHLGFIARWSPVKYRTLQQEQEWQAAELLPNVDLPDDYRIGSIQTMIRRW